MQQAASSPQEVSATLQIPHSPGPLPTTPEHSGYASEWTDDSPQRQPDAGTTANQSSLKRKREDDNEVTLCGHEDTSKADLNSLLAQITGADLRERTVLEGLRAQGASISELVSNGFRAAAQSGVRIPYAKGRVKFVPDSPERPAIVVEEHDSSVKNTDDDATLYNTPTGTDADAILPKFSSRSIVSVSREPNRKGGKGNRMELDWDSPLTIIFNDDHASTSVAMFGGASDSAFFWLVAENRSYSV
ncbi:hypothetical protein M427DRAFT_133195 [Gonapodya prolifera JEL478]|uniref:Uncharacterized protein n=1 Tax=Gonapodya prolifera (strain JEL478) TaxID=1344416 RepID=A0A139AME2_GONPJ|nr:hypothetical protein M427DRAFT_133195 [Gonapodya prolifera JEL478]|eukprot:KXS17693.1 hypothetical protein M427DRAFT_133195 [Gonapodya prolifera JEL478]